MVKSIDLLLKTPKYGSFVGVYKFINQFIYHKKNTGSLFFSADGTKK